MVIPREEKNQLKSILENWNLGFLTETCLGMLIINN